MAKKAKKNNGARRKKSKKQQSGFVMPLFKKAVKWGFVAGLWISIMLGLLIAWYAAELPSVTESMVFERRPAITVKSADGTILHRYGDIQGESIAIEELPSHLIYAILATEDRRFYQHFGLDPMGVARAFVVNIREMGFVQGGSTITQQLAKNLFLSRERTIKRKIQEAILAIWLEQNLTKDEILSAYLNRVYMGAGAYGIDAAAKVYYGKAASELTLRESATLAGLLKAPSRYSPSANPELAAQRAQVVMNAMVEAGFIQQAEVSSLDNLPPSPRRKPSSGETVRYFTDYVVSQMNDLVGPIQKDLIIETTLSKDIQTEAEESITKALLQYGPDRKIDQGAAVVLRLDGAIMAMVGGKDYSRSQFNRATNSYRSPGSSFKPIVYLTALEQGWSPEDIIIDEPIEKGRYRPKNFKNEYFGEVTLTEALTRSLNTVAFQLTKETHPREVISMARRLGITADLEPDLSIGLGSGGVPIIEMATAYATLGRGGLAVEPFAIERILDEDGTIYYERPYDPRVRQIVGRQNVTDLTAMMQSVVEFGTGQAAQLPRPAAGKTGTSQDFRDAWFIGFTDKYAGAVWVGKDDNSPMSRVTGGFVPARVWKEVMLKAHSSGGPAYNYYTSAVPDSGFHDMISRLISGDAFSSTSRRDPARGEEYTPLGRHQWDLNN